MLFLLQPIWLITAAGIGIPVIISLWNNRQGKIRKIGSVFLLEKINRQHTRNRLPSEWLLLALRCLLLIFLALFLSGPYWKRTLTENSHKGWVLTMEKGGSVHFTVYRPLIDSLLKAGYTLHEMNAEDSGFSTKGKPASYWTLFRAADRAAPSGLPFYIFTKGELNHFSGNRPVTDRNIHWYTEPGRSPDSIGTSDTVKRWIERAWTNSGDSKEVIRVLTGSSRRTGNTYNQGIWERGQAGMTGGRLSVFREGQPPVIVDTEAIRITIYAENKDKPDFRYLLAAFRSLEEFTQRRFVVTVIGTLQQLKRVVLPGSGRQDWLFWLSPEPFPEDIFKADTVSRQSSFANIFRWEQGKETQEETWIDGNPEIWIGRMTGVTSLPDQNAVLWKDGYGRALLALGKKSEGDRSNGCRIFHFYSRFDPSWNGLVWSPSFPLLLQQLIFEPAAYPGKTEIMSPARDLASDLSRDIRIIDPLQILPRQDQPGYTEEVAGSALAGSTGSVDLARGTWILIFILFLLERIAARSGAKTKSYG